MVSDLNHFSEVVPQLRCWNWQSCAEAPVLITTFFRAWPAGRISQRTISRFGSTDDATTVATPLPIRGNLPSSLLIWWPNFFLTLLSVFAGLDVSNEKRLLKLAETHINLPRSASSIRHVHTQNPR